ncbi:MAG: efflux RND transporter periplasmic adaptor subunit [Gammaproteobacteria bacterium]|nr:efflux RND transporter periplasmic adaptor subunit [Gammaproteobacteria bacterium]
MNFRILALCLASLTACDGGHVHDEEHSHDHDAPAETEFERGPHNGRLLRDKDFALEITIFETGVPPQFRLYAYKNERPVPATDVTASITLSRLGGKTDTFGFAPSGDQLVGSGEVVEPHSFDVKVVARHAGTDYRWEYPSYEGRTSITAAVAEAAGLETAIAGPATVRDVMPLLGRVALNGNRYAEVRARYPGPVETVRVAVGDTVRAGDTLATIENADTLRTYMITSPISGVVLARHTNAGDVATGNTLFEIADLSELWVELNAFGSDASRLRPGLEVRLQSATGGESAVTRIERLLPLASAASQTVVARAPLPNPDGKWRPGLMVNAEVTVAEREVPLAVDVSGLQRFRDFTVVFARIGDTYEVRMLELGDRDSERAEVLGGLDPGTRYVTAQSFLIKADIEKSGASHDH